MDELKKRLQKYQILAERANDAIFFIGQNGDILEVNPAALKMYGYSLEEFLAMKIFKLRGADEKLSVLEQMKVAGQEGLIFETIHYRQDGTPIHVEVSSQGTLYENKRVLVSIVRDITERQTINEALRNSESLLRKSQEIGRIGSYVLDFQTGLWKSSDELETIFGIDKDYPNTVEGWLGIVHPDWREKLSGHYVQVETKQQRFDYEYKIIRVRDGEERWVHGLGELKFDHHSKLVRLMGTIQDITDRKLIEQVLWHEQERAQVTLASIGDGVLTTDVKGRITYLNPVAQTLTGWTQEEAQGLEIEHVFDICHESTKEVLPQPVRQCLLEQCTIALANHAMLRHRDGQQAFPIEDTAAPIRDREGQVIGAVLVFHDVSEKRLLLRRLSHQAHHDALTDLPNRLLFKDRAHQAILQARRRQEQVAVFFFDLDDFKLVNDTLGHAAGDSLLCQVGERLTRSLRQEDTVARQGGDEFLILLPELSLEQQAAQVAQKVLLSFNAPFQLLEQDIFITASLGIALYPVDGEEPELLIQHADMAMYQAKTEGRNHYQFYTLSLNERLSERLAIQNEMRRALERQEFVLYYQPQYRLGDGQFCGMEALVRWQHPERGLLLPGKFISIAEDSGLILPLGEWVLRTACAQNKHWQDMGYPPVRVAVNLSARQFREKDLVSRVAEILSETGLEAEWLELEITESLSMENVRLSVEILRKLKSMGIRLSIDDFGTGFSSLSYLSRFPLNTLKIDRSFISVLNTHSDGNAIVLTIIQLAQNLGLKVIAEGVETEAQLDFLRAKGCDEVQGFLMAKPAPMEELLEGTFAERHVPTSNITEKGKKS